MNKKIVSYVPKIKSFLFIQTLFKEEIKNKAEYIFVKTVLHVKSNHYVQREDTGKYMLKKESSFGNKSGKD